MESLVWFTQQLNIEKDSLTKAMTEVREKTIALNGALQFASYLQGKVEQYAEEQARGIREEGQEEGEGKEYEGGTNASVDEKEHEKDEEEVVGYPPHLVPVI